MASNLKTVLALSLACGAAARGQMTQTQIQNFPFPPPKALTGSKSFGFAGDSYSATTPRPSPTINLYQVRDMTYSDYDYYILSNTRNKRIWVTVAYGGTPPTQNSCLHTHVSYGVKGNYTVTYAGFTYKGWSWTGGGTMSGVWNSARNRCYHSVNNSLTKDQPLFGWGQDIVEAVGTSFSSGTTRYIDALMVAVAANTHGPGDCAPNPGVGNFEMCLDAVRLTAWSGSL